MQTGFRFRCLSVQRLGTQRIHFLLQGLYLLPVALDFFALSQFVHGEIDGAEDNTQDKSYKDVEIDRNRRRAPLQGKDRKLETDALGQDFSVLNKENHGHKKE
jgi:hypothetical protein